MQRAEIERLWQDSRHWKGIGFYSCPEDPRIVVPKRQKWAGWTINFAHPWAMPTLLGIVAIAAGPTWFLVAAGITNVYAFLFTTLSTIALLVLVSIYLSARTE